MSAAEVARELDLTHANASYHLRVLAAADLVVQAGGERIRGGVAKRYRHLWDRPEAVHQGTEAGVWEEVISLIDRAARLIHARRNPLAPLRETNFAWYYASRFANTLGTMMAGIALTLRRARPHRLGHRTRPGARSAHHPRWWSSCSSEASLPIGFPGHWCFRRRT
ncbi:MAG: helix-turn-helix domain-containing protein [Actinomycetota bacterium]|nr:helix-turn-helix domain-containing protein [Actinomycetota bacterium]